MVFGKILVFAIECSTKNIVKCTTKFDECNTLNTLRLMQLMKCKKGEKYCRRHNWPKGCMLSPKELLFSHVTSWSNFSFRVSTTLKLQNLDQTCGSKFWPIFSHKISTKLQPQKGWQAIAKLKPHSLFISLFQHFQILSKSSWMEKWKVKVVLA